MSSPDPLSPATLLGESAWLQRLAARLVAEPSGAADAAQEALTRALERPPAATVPLRRWLAAVLRNVVRQERRTAGRREARERARPVALEAEPADELALRLELHERLVAAVRALDEPYRSTIALRFLEDLPPRIVAERMGVPVKTVHTRLERALEQLRARLDREHGGRKAWVGLLLPLSTPRVPLDAAAPNTLAPLHAAPLLVPFVAMGTLWKWTSACAALAALGFFAVRASVPDAPRAAPQRALAVETARTELTAPGTMEMETALPQSKEREAVAPQSNGTAVIVPEAVEATAPTLAGVVLDLERRPVPGLTVYYEQISTMPGVQVSPIDGRAESDERGRFALPGTDGPCRIVAHGRGYATVIAAALAGPPSPEPPIVFVGGERSYAGHVLDAGGSPVAGAELTVSLDEALARELTPGSFAGTLPIARAESDADGHFSLPVVGGAPRSRLFARAEGLKGGEIELPEESSADLVLVLGPLPAVENALSGHVLRADGRPAVGAYVSTGDAAVRTGEDGGFELALRHGDRAERLRAVLAGFLPAELELAGFTDEARADLVIVLGDAARRIAGRVLDDRGEPIAGARVWTGDEERFGKIPTRMGDIELELTFSVESLMAGARLPQDDGRRALSDEGGRFELSGLAARRYALFACHPRTQELVGPLEVAAGADGVVLILAGAEPAHVVAGQGTTYSGAPIAGAHVRVQRRLRAGDGGTRTHRVEHSFHARSDAEGRFRFDELCTAGTELLVSADDFPGETSCALDGEPELERIVVHLPAACHLRVFLEDPAGADSLMLEDERGEDLEFSMQLGGLLLGASAIHLAGSVSDLITTDERARTLVLHKGQEEVARIPLQLRPGEVNEIRF